jgi:hypothetical protein
MKYYILKRLTENLVNEYLMDIPQDKWKSIEKRIDLKKPLLLIEKTITQNKVTKETTEIYSNIFFISEGCDSNWTDITKGKVMYDYTGVVYPLVHFRGEVKFFKDFSK